MTEKGDPERIKEIRRLRSGPDRKTLREVADIMHITPERVRQLEGGVYAEERAKERKRRYLRIYNFQKKYHDRYQRYASQAEVVKSGVVISRTMLINDYKAMKLAGMIKIDEGVARGIRLLPLETEKESETVQVLEAA